MSSSFFIEQLEPRRHLTAVKVMPLGDSITEGYTGGYPSYRYWLWNALRAYNYDVDFVGSMTGVHGAAPARPDYDQNHEGHSGWRADQILANIGTWAPLYQPDVVLMHVGTNDMLQGQSVSSTITEIGSIIDALRQTNPNIIVVMAQIIPSTISATQIQQLNAQIGTLATQKNTEQSRVMLVDQWTGFSTAADEWDGIHPNEAGELKMANKWYGALQNVIAPSGAQPGPSTYLSSLNWSSVSNGFGPVESNRSNAEQALGDGRPITLNSTVYARGLGMHAPSDVTYPINRQFYEFRAQVGMDDEAGANGSAVFRVYADNVLVYDSGTMTATTATKSLRVDLNGKRVLRLQVTDAGNGNTWDHADWADATLFRRPVTGGTTPPPLPNLGGMIVGTISSLRLSPPERLDDLKPIV